MEKLSDFLKLKLQYRNPVLIVRISQWILTPGQNATSGSMQISEIPSGAFAVCGEMCGCEMASSIPDQTTATLGQKQQLQREDHRAGVTTAAYVQGQPGPDAVRGDVSYPVCRDLSAAVQGPPVELQLCATCQGGSTRFKKRYPGTGVCVRHHVLGAGALGVSLLQSGYHQQVQLWSAAKGRGGRGLQVGWVWSQREFRPQLWREVHWSCFKEQERPSEKVKEGHDEQTQFQGWERGGVSQYRERLQVSRGLRLVYSQDMLEGAAKLQWNRRQAQGEVQVRSGSETKTSEKGQSKNLSSNL